MASLLFYVIFDGESFHQVLFHVGNGHRALKGGGYLIAIILSFTLDETPSRERFFVFSFFSAKRHHIIITSSL